MSDLDVNDSRSIEALRNPDAIQRYFKRVVAATVKGLKCAKCDAEVNALNIRKFDFDHVQEIKDRSSLDQRWTSMRSRPLSEIMEWLPSVVLLCRECHVKKHNQKNQLSILDYIEVQMRLDQFDPGPMPYEQITMDVLGGGAV